MDSGAGPLLVEAGLISAAQLREARAAGGLLVPHLVESGVLSEETAADLFRVRLMLPRLGAADLRGASSRAIRKVPPEVAEEFGVVPVAVDREEQLTLAMADPTDTHAVDEVAFHSGLYVLRAVALWSDVRAALLQHYGDPTRKRPRMTPSPAARRPPGPALRDEDLADLFSAPQAEPVILLTRAKTGVFQALSGYGDVSRGAPAAAPPDAAAPIELPARGPAPGLTPPAPAASPPPPVPAADAGEAAGAPPASADLLPEPERPSRRETRRGVPTVPAPATEPGVPAAPAPDAAPAAGKPTTRPRVPAAPPPAAPRRAPTTEPGVPAPPPVPATPVGARPLGEGPARAALARLAAARDRDAVVEAALDVVGAWADRGAFLVVKRGVLCGWAARGPETMRSHVRRIAIPLDEPSLFRQAIEYRLAYRGPLRGGRIERLFGEWAGSHPDSVLIPLVAGTRVVGMLYGGPLRGEPDGAVLIEAGRLAGHALETLIRGHRPDWTA